MLTTSHLSPETQVPSSILQHLQRVMFDILSGMMNVKRVAALEWDIMCQPMIPLRTSELTLNL